MIYERIKNLRESNNRTQTDLAKYLGISRSGVNAWEMGISVPSTRYIVELAKLFNVSTDYLLGVKETANISVEGLSESDIALIYSIIERLKDKRKN